MIIQCESCARKFLVKDQDIPKQGRTVQCGYCSVSWHQMPNTKIIKKKENKVSKPIAEPDEGPSVDSIKASDGKTYRFLGSQWAQLLPSGKTGLFAKKKISRELDKITGRKEQKVIKKKHKKIGEVNPSSGSINNEKHLPEIYKSKEGMGFFGYIFLIIIVGFSLVGIAKTFENDILNKFPEYQNFFYFLDDQLVYIAETVKNIFVIINDLINSY